MNENVMLLLVMLISLAVGFLAASFVFMLGYRVSQMNLEEAKLERADQEFTQLEHAMRFCEAPEVEDAEEAAAPE